MSQINFVFHGVGIDEDNGLDYWEAIDHLAGQAAVRANVSDFSSQLFVFM